MASSKAQHPHDSYHASGAVNVHRSVNGEMYTMRLTSAGEKAFGFDEAKRAEVSKSATTKVEDKNKK